MDEGEIRATTDQMLDMVGRLATLERAKQEQSLGSDELVELAHEAEELSRVVFRWAGLQTQLAESSREQVARGELPRERIIDVAAQPLDRLLAQWREAQLRFELAKPGSEEAATASAEIESLREAFLATQAAKRVRQS